MNGFFLELVVLKGDGGNFVVFISLCVNPGHKFLKIKFE